MPDMTTRQMRAAIEAGIDSADDLTPDERALLDKALNASAELTDDERELLDKSTRSHRWRSLLGLARPGG